MCIRDRPEPYEGEPIDGEGNAYTRDLLYDKEAMDIAGGACDGIFDPSRGYVMRGGREMENHFECLWAVSYTHLDVYKRQVLNLMCRQRK